MPRIPPWIRLNWRTGTDFASVQNLVNNQGLHTVCQSAKCPNIHECWGRGTATIMILGNLCTRSCKFCSVPHGRPKAVDTDEPRRVAEAAANMNLKHIVLTSVNRDDLPDGGAEIFAETIRAIRRIAPEMRIEILTPDFEGNEAAMNTVMSARPDIFSHNVETVRRLQAEIRPQASYGRSLAVLKYCAEWRPKTAIKSGMMLGMGETDDEIVQALQDLYDAGCRIAAIGQYLQPTRHNRPVDRYVMPSEFDRIADIARKIGFAGVASGPMVRSSYRAEELFQAALDQDPELREAAGVAPAAG